MNIRIFFLIIVVFISSCINNSKKSGKSGIQNQVESIYEVIAINPSEANNVKCSELFEAFKYVTLETNDSVLIAGVDKIDIVDSTLYLLDRRGFTVWVYTMDGKYLNKIDHRGRGAGEYLSCADMCVSDNIKILDRSGQKIEIYDLQGNHQKTVSIGQISNAFYACNDDQYWLFTKGNDMYTKYANSKLSYNLFYVNKDQKRGFIPYNKYIDNLYSEDVFNYSRVLDELLFWSPRRDTIYSLRNGNAISKYFVDFGKNRIPLELYKNIEIKDKPEFASILNCLQSEKYLFLNYSHENRVKFFITDKVSKKINGRTLINDTDGISLLLCTPKYIINDQLLFVRHAYEIVNQINDPKNSKYKDKYSCFSDLKETDNPVLIFGKLNNSIKSNS